MVTLPAEVQKPLLLVAESKPVDAPNTTLPPSQPTNNVAQPTMTASPNHCLGVGPFEKPGTASQVMAQLTSSNAGNTASITSEKVPRDFWLYVPAQKDDSATHAALALLRRASVEGVVMTKGNRANAISIGTYNLKIAAEKTREKLKRVGVDAVIEPRFKKNTQYWIMFNPMTASEANDLRLKVAQVSPGLSFNERDCTSVPQFR